MWSALIDSPRKRDCCEREARDGFSARGTIGATFATGKIRKHGMTCVSPAGPELNVKLVSESIRKKRERKKLRRNRKEEKEGREKGRVVY